MARLRAKISPAKENSQVGRYEARGLSKTAKNRLKLLKICIFVLIISLLANILQFMTR